MTKYTNDMVAHVWAQGNECQGESNNGQFFFEGGNIYSYGKHFLIAMRDNNGIVLFTEQTYSVTTQRHISLTWQAMSQKQREECVHIPEFNTYAHVAQRGKNGKFKDVGLNHKKNWQWFKDELQKCLEQAATARKNSKWRMIEAMQVKAKMEKYKKYFGLRYKVPELEHNREELKKALAKRKQAEKRRLDKENKAKIKEFRAGKRVHIRGDFALLRITGDNIETSQGATFPIEHAKAAFRVIKVARKMQVAYTYKTDGPCYRLGHFKIDAIDSKGNVKAGCHKVKYDEIEQCAKALGLI